MKDTKEPAIILLVLFILVGLAYGQPQKTDTSKSGDIWGTPSTVGSNTPGTSVEENIKNAQEEIKRLEESLKKKTEEGRRSPFYGKIKMSGISGLYGNEPDQEYIYFYTNLEDSETLKITGWYLKSEITGYYVVIGKAALLPFPFTRTESDVILKKGDRVYLTKGFSPIGISFRTNKCTGFFEENRTFIPGLALQCPRAIDEKLPIFSTDLDRNDECLNIIENIPRCTTVSSSFFRKRDTVPESCKTYVTTQINYNSCVAKHFSDADFPGDEYRLYLNKFGPLWRQKKDKINLHDQNGLIVDTIQY